MIGSSVSSVIPHLQHNDDFDYARCTSYAQHLSEKAEVALSLDTTLSELKPGVVLEFDGGATAALVKRRREASEAIEAPWLGLLAQILKMPEGSPAGAIDATVDALDVVFLAVAKRFDEGISGAAHWAESSRYGELGFGHGC
jgi:hypothetical protein